MMPNAYPPRKMTSTIPVPQGNETTVDDRTGGMNTIKALAKAIKKNGKLKT